MIFLYSHTLLHYRVPIFNRLSDACGRQLVVVFGQQASGAGHLADGLRFARFDYVQAKNHWFLGGKALWQPFLEPFRLYGKPRAVIVQHCPRIVTLAPFMAYCSLKGVRHILWGHGGSRRRDIRSHTTKDFIQRMFVKQCDAYICYTENIKERLAEITSPEKLFVATNTLDTELLGKLRKDLEDEGRQTVKQRLGMNRDHYLCFIGRLIPSKQPERVLDVLRLLQRQMGATVGAVFIGDGPEKAELVRKASAYGLEGVHFPGAISDWSRSASYLFASDVLLNPGEVGLSVNHALSFGLPIITQDSDSNGPFHGPEAAFIRQGETGYCIPKDDLSLMVSRITDILRDRSRWYGQAVAYAANELSVDRMIEGMVGAMTYVTGEEFPIRPVPQSY